VPTAINKITLSNLFKDVEAVRYVDVEVLSPAWSQGPGTVVATAETQLKWDGKVRVTMREVERRLGLRFGFGVSAVGFGVDTTAERLYDQPLTLHPPNPNLDHPQVGLRSQG
jgi:hypothetical protein